MSDKIDTCVIGGSAGSLTALKDLLPAIPEDLSLVILLCQHVPSTSETALARLLAPVSPLPVTMAKDGMALEAGQIYVAPPDTHMMLGQEHVHLRRGAHENNFRPAIDPLFRSAAVYRATRAVGVILSGLMDDGAAGAWAMSRTGGTILVQDPATAEFPDMPSAALSAVPSARALGPEKLAAALVDLSETSAPPAPSIPWDIGVELKIAALEGASMSTEKKLGELSPFNCPHCNGVLWEINDGPITRYRCHTGHSYTMKSLSSAQDEMLDRGLFDSLRAHRGRAALLRKMCDRASPASRRMLARRAELVEEDAERLEKIIKGRKTGQTEAEGLER